MHKYKLNLRDFTNNTIIIYMIYVFLLLFHLLQWRNFKKNIMSWYWCKYHLWKIIQMCKALLYELISEYLFYISKWNSIYIYIKMQLFGKCLLTAMTIFLLILIITNMVNGKYKVLLTMCSCIIVDLLLVT